MSFLKKLFSPEVGKGDLTPVGKKLVTNNSKPVKSVSVVKTSVVFLYFFFSDWTSGV